MNPPDQREVEVSEEAVELAAEAFERVPDGAQFRERLSRLPEYGETVVTPSELAREMLQAAAPVLCAQERERLGNGVVDLSGGPVLAQLPSGEVAKVLGYVVSHDDGGLEVMMVREEEGFDRDELLAALGEDAKAEAARSTLATIRSWCDDNPASDEHSGGWLLASQVADLIDSAALDDDTASLDSIRQQAAEEERKRQERYAASEREEATRRLLKAEAERDQAAQQERERLGMEKCPDPECEEGVVCVTGTERGPEGEPIPVPEQERCPTCGGHGFISAFTRAAVKAAAQQERERIGVALEGLERLDPEHDESHRQEFALGNDPILMSPCEDGDYIDRAAALAILNQENSNV